MFVACGPTGVPAAARFPALLHPPDFRPPRGLPARKSSPCALKLSQIRRFCACWASFFAEMPVEGRCWRVFSRQPVLCPGLVVDAAHFGLAAVGVLHYTKPSCGVSPACRAPVSCNSPAWGRRGRGSRWCGRHSADPLGEKRPKSMVVAEWVCVLAGSVSVVACWSHVNPLLRAVTRSVARRPAMWSVGGTAQARISGLTCGLEGLRARGCWLPVLHPSMTVDRGPTCAWMLECPGDNSCADGPRFGVVDLEARPCLPGPSKPPPLLVYARGGTPKDPASRCVRRPDSSPRTSARSKQPDMRWRQARSAQFFHQPLTVSMACVPRSDSAECALTRPEDRRAAWKREVTFSQFTRFHQALT